MGVLKISEINNGRSAIRFALPAIIMTVFMSTYSMIDGLFISRYVGTDAVGATNILLPVICLATAIGFMFSSGGTAWIGRKLGMGKKEEARSDASLIIVVAFVLSIGVSILSLSFMRPLVYLLGADDVLFGYAYDYGMSVALFFPLLVLQMIIGEFVIVSGKPIHSMASFIGGGITNIVLDCIFIVNLEMGVAGAALATGIGASIPVFIGLFILTRKSCELRLSKPSGDYRALFGSCCNGASEMISELSVAVTSLLFNITMMRCAGADGVAAISVILYVQTFAVSAVVGYMMGTSSITAYNYGARNGRNLNMMFFNGLLVSAIISIASFMVLFLCGSELAILFAGDAENVRMLIEQGTFIFSFGFLMAGFNIFASGMFTALSDGSSSAIISVFRGLILLVPSIVLLSELFGTIGVWFSIPITEMITLVISLYLLKQRMPLYGIRMQNGNKGAVNETVNKI